MLPFWISKRWSPQATGRHLILIASLSCLLFACSAPRASDTRAVVIAIDGADWRLIEPLIAAGELPHLASLRQRGTWGPIETLHDIALSPAIWTSVATGRSPVDHGITWFMAGVGDQRTAVRSHDREVPAIWNLLASQGLTASVVGWWATYPAEDVGPGTIISDALGVHGYGVSAVNPDPRQTTYPANLGAEMTALMPPLQQISSAFLQRFVDLETTELTRRLFHPGRQSRPDPKEPLQLFQDYAATAQGYTAIAETLLARRKDVLTMVYYEQVDSLSHLFMRYAPPALPEMPLAEQRAFARVVGEWYRYQDELLGRLLANIDLRTTAVFVLSDHGFKSGDRRLRRNATVDPQAAHLEHEPDGIFIAAGPGIRRDGKVAGLSVLDMTPTLLHYLGLAVAKDMDGRVADEIFELDSPSDRQITWVESYGKDSIASPRQEAADTAVAKIDDEAIERLRALGYVGGGSSRTVPDESTPGVSTTASPEVSPEMLNSRGSLQLANQDLEAAEASFRHALLLDPEAAEALLGLASVARARGDLVSAQRQVQKALQLDPRSTAAIAGLADLRRDEGRLDDAIQLYRRALNLNDANPDLFLRLSDALHQAGRPEEARRAVRKALSLTPDSFAGHYNLGVINLAEGRLEAAQSNFETALAKEGEHPNAAYALNNLASIWLDKGSEAEALAAFRRAVAIAPEQFTAQFNLGSILLGQGENTAALEPLEAAANLRPDHVQTLVHLGLVYLRLDQPRSATRVFEAARLLAPDAWHASLGLAAISAANGQPKMARKLFAEALAKGGAEARQAALTFPALVALDPPLPAAPP